MQIFSFPALSQDENEMGRFLRDQGATDKTKAGKMMIAVGKAQSYAAQQRYWIVCSFSTPMGFVIWSFAMILYFI